MKAYAALQKLRAGDRSAETVGEFERTKADLGYGLLLRKYAANVVDASPEQIKLAVADTIPQVAPLFWSFRLMVGLGLWLLFIFAAAFYLIARRLLYRNRWIMHLALWSIPLPWIAAELGWVVAEYGRQPWAISEVLPTHLSVSSVSAAQVIFSLAGFVAFYTALLIVELYLMFKYARAGPASLGTGRYQCWRKSCGGRSMIYLFDYATLKLIWWLLVGVLLVGFAILDGFDLGVCILLPFVGRSDVERRVMLNAIGPTWEGNQVWLISAGAGLFAAWPLVYATAFSGLYAALILTLFALFFRPVGFEYRGKSGGCALAQRLGLGIVRRLRRAGADLRGRLSATCCRAFRSTLTPTSVCSTPARSSGCSTRSRCSPA